MADHPGRKAIVEPVIGQMKTRQNTNYLTLRGLSGAIGGSTLHAICHALRELVKAAET
jgi:hypothetical protein